MDEKTDRKDKFNKTDRNSKYNKNSGIAAKKHHGDDFHRHDRRDRGDNKIPENLIIGRNAVRELLTSGMPVERILVSGKEGSIIKLIEKAREMNIPVVETETVALDRLSLGENHQGIAAYVGEKDYSTVEEMLADAAAKNELPLIVVCDGIEDPHNLGAVIRCAECAGAHGVIIPERRACGLTPAVSKASAGAIMHMKVARVSNIAQTIEKLKDAGVWTFAAEADGMDFYDADFHLPCAIVLGGEDSGVSRLVRERCDFTISIPMWGHVNSLNVSTAASVILTRAARIQRM